MAQTPAQDVRTADDPELLAAIAARDPLALAEAYHRLVPAAHAVARRLVSGAAEVEEVLLAVFDRLWTSPPTDVPAEGWIRRTTWAAAAERLRASSTAPASPSAAGLLPDLPAPDVRFLDAAERAIAELPDDERRALLLAHDKGVPSSGQEPGADAALVRALLALAGPETSAADRSAMQEDPAEDVPGMGDWSLGVADDATAAAVAAAIEDRPGAAARSRAIRRGRRRIEGLPATPDMGQRVLVRVLTAGAAGSMAAPTAASMAVPAAAAASSASETAAPAGPDGAEPADLFADMGGGAAADAGEGAVAADGDDIAMASGADALMDTADLPAASGQQTAPASSDKADGELGDPAAAPTAAPGDDEVDGVAAAAEDGGDPPAAAADVDGGGRTVEAGHEDWAPNPGDTAELRLSDILAEDEDPDDPFADLERDDPQRGGVLQPLRRPAGPRRRRPAGRTRPLQRSRGPAGPGRSAAGRGLRRGRGDAVRPPSRRSQPGRGLPVLVAADPRRSRRRCPHRGLGVRPAELIRACAGHLALVSR